MSLNLKRREPSSYRDALHVNCPAVDLSRAFPAAARTKKTSANEPVSDEHTGAPFNRVPVSVKLVVAGSAAQIALCNSVKRVARRYRRYLPAVANTVLIKLAGLSSTLPFARSNKKTRLFFPPFPLTSSVQPDRGR